MFSLFLNVRLVYIDDLIIVVYASATKSTTPHSIASAQTMVLETLMATPTLSSEYQRASSC